MDGNHVVHRSEGFWNGISVDLSIELNLMANFKSSAGCTHGWGADEDKANIFLLSFPIVGEVRESFSLFTCVKRKTSEQHEEEGSVRKKRL